MDNLYYQKYMKYKNKYLSLKRIQLGGRRNNDQENDLIEIIYNSKSGIKTEIIKKNNKNKTDLFLRKNNLFKKPQEIFHVLDLHNVLDLLDHKHKIKRSENNKIICCSYVGKYSKMRTFARSEVISRINSKQIDWGVLVFKRGRDSNNENPNNYHKSGSKAWFCNLVKADYFFDDSNDHINSVKSMLKSKVKVKQILNKKILLDQINKIKH